MENFLGKFSNLGIFVDSLNVPTTRPAKTQLLWYLFESHLVEGGGGG